VVLWQGRPLVWFDRRSHHLVTFPDTLDSFGGPAWADALAARVNDGRARSMEVRKVDGETVDARSPLADVLRRSGFVDSYRGLVFRAS
jgi:ATP-dependent helicase Lhr and Lhr-like helicase